MQDYSCIIFDLYNTILDDTNGLAEREQFRLDNIYTILEKSLIPIKFPVLQKAYRDMCMRMAEEQASLKKSFNPFQQVDDLLARLHIRDTVVFKRVYDSYVDSALQISPKLMPNAARALEVLKDRNRKVGLISNTGKTPGYVLRILLRELNVIQYFDDLVFSDEAGIMKPDPMIFDLALRRLGAPKKETIFIGDLQGADFEGARTAGLSAHLFKKDTEDLYELAVMFTGGYS